MADNVYLWKYGPNQTKSSQFDNSTTFCKKLGGTLPEPTSYDVIQILIEEMIKHQFSKGFIHIRILYIVFISIVVIYVIINTVWLGVIDSDDRMRWNTSGFLVKNNYNIAYNNLSSGSCMTMNQIGEW